jgi:hypothetical protein
MCRYDTPAWWCPRKTPVIRIVVGTATSDDPFVPPPGIEPEPPGLQPSAQTNYARVGYERRACFEGTHDAQIIIIIIFSCQRAHLTRFRDLESDPESVESWCWSGRNERRPPGCPGGLHETHVVTWLQCRTSKTRIKLHAAIDATRGRPHGWSGQAAAPSFGTNM